MIGSGSLSSSGLLGFLQGKRNRCWKFPDCRNAYPTVEFVLRGVVLKLRRGQAHLGLGAREAIGKRCRNGPRHRRDNRCQLYAPAIRRRRWAMRQRSVSHPRSSNRTCRFPASGSPTGFTARHTDQITDRKRHLRGVSCQQSRIVVSVLGPPRRPSLS
jgi:hypothetical protein